MPLVSRYPRSFRYVFIDGEYLSVNRSEAMEPDGNFEATVGARVDESGIELFER